MSRMSRSVNTVSPTAINFDSPKIKDTLKLHAGIIQKSNYKRGNSTRRRIVFLRFFFIRNVFCPSHQSSSSHCCCRSRRRSTTTTRTSESGGLTWGGWSGGPWLRYSPLICSVTPWKTPLYTWSPPGRPPQTPSHPLGDPLIQPVTPW